MATNVLLDRPVGLAEIRQHDFDFNPDLETGATVVTPSAVHTPPSGAAATPTVGTPAAGVVPVQLGPLAAGQLGYHTLDCFAVTSNGEKLQIHLTFKVEY